MHGDEPSLTLSGPQPSTKENVSIADWIWEAGFLAILGATGIGVAFAVSSADFYALHVLLASAIALSIGGAVWLALIERSVAIFSGFVLLYCLFHFGNVPNYLIDPWARPETALEWYHDEPLIRQAYLSALIFVIGIYSAVPLRHLIRIEPSKPIPHNAELSFDTIACIVLAILVGIWFLIVKVILSIDNYGEYLERAPGDYVKALSILYPLISGITIFGCLWGKRIWPLISIFVIWAIPALLVGLRYGVFIPLMVLLLCLHTQGRCRIRWWVALVGSISTLAAISFIREFRFQSIGVVDAVLNVSPITALSEMGFSIYPMRAVIEWLATGVDYPRWGETYWAPFERTLAIILSSGRVPAQEDFRLMNVAIAARNGNHGFSISAEAMINFGLPGCFFIGSLVGALLLYGGKAIESKHGAILATGVVFGIFVHVRQSFVTAYGNTVWFVVAGAALWAFAWLISRLRSMPDAATPQ